MPIYVPKYKKLKSSYLQVQFVSYFVWLWNVFFYFVENTQFASDLCVYRSCNFYNIYFSQIKYSVNTIVEMSNQVWKKNIIV
jgi:hypothetical protein